MLVLLKFCIELLHFFNSLPYHPTYTDIRNKGKNHDICRPNKRHMKRIFFAIFLLASVQLEAQPTVREQFEKINTVADAEKYVTANASLKPAILRLSYGKDTAIIDKRLLKQNKGDIFSVGFVTYKVVDVKESNAYRASYIFLDRGSLNNREVDSLSKLIVGKLNAGESFESLSDKYTMDGNDTKGDLGWFYGEGQVPKEVQ